MGRARAAASVYRLRGEEYVVRLTSETTMKKGRLREVWSAEVLNRAPGRLAAYPPS